MYLMCGGNSRCLVAVVVYVSVLRLYVRVTRYGMRDNADMIRCDSFFLFPYPYLSGLHELAWGLCCA